MADDMGRANGGDKRIAFYTLGCKVNQYESQALAERFASLGYEVVAPEEEADIYVINSCTVTGIADRKSRNFARRSKRINPDALTVLAGCYAEVAGEKLKEIPEIDLVVGSKDKERLPELLGDRLAAGQPVRGVTGLADRARAYIKIEDGCDRYCAFCVVPYARGAVRSRALGDIVGEARALIANGYKELILTGVNAALYGSDAPAGDVRASGIIAVVDAISELGGDFRIRLSSLEPTVVDAACARELVKRERLCPHLHLSLQSGSDRILSAMGRRYTMEDYLRIVDVLKSHDANYSVTTDLIVGFPGETDADFKETLAAVDKVGFSKIHVFKYSRRAGTRAASMDGQLAGQVKAERSRRLIAAGECSAARFIAANGGSVRKALFLSSSDGLCTGITDNDITCQVRTAADMTGTIRSVRLGGDGVSELV